MIAKATIHKGNKRRGESSFANFIRSSGPEKDAAMMQVINAACDRQNAVLSRQQKRPRTEE